MVGIPPPVVYYYNTSLTQFLSNIGYVLNRPSRGNDGIEANSIAISKDTVNKLRCMRRVQKRLENNDVTKKTKSFRK